MITDTQRTLIEKELGVRVSNRYGACEFGVMAQEKEQGPKGELLVFDSLVWPEIYCAPDEKVCKNTGELVFTNLRNPAMPLIRYCMGDIGTLTENDNGWWISDLNGRVHDNVEIEGIVYPTHHIQDILDRCGAISDFQILISNEKVIEFRLVAEPCEWEAISQAVCRYFPSVPLRLIRADELEFVGIRGKFSYILRK